MVSILTAPGLGDGLPLLGGEGDQRQEGKEEN